ncbi:MAG: hypothetical protein ACTH2Q_06490 [Propionibacteriaceae bacterium]
MTDHPPHVECTVFVRTPAARVAAALAARTAEWADDLALHPYDDRGPEGLRMVVTGPLEGSAEWWLEPGPPVADDRERGVVVHFWLRGRASTRVLIDRLLPGRRTRVLLANHERRIRRMLGTLKTDLEAALPGSKVTPCTNHPPDRG